jgi:hypothetical protein
MDLDAITSLKPVRGPLTPQERDRRYKNHLCIVCGASDHLKAQCPKSRHNVTAAAISTAKSAQITAINVHGYPPYPEGDLSLLAMTTSASSSKILVSVTIGPHSISALALIDSGADRSFISNDLATSIALPPQILATPLSVSLATSATSVTVSSYLPAVLISIDNHQNISDLIIAPNLSFPLILGFDWLQSHNPIIDWTNRTITFPHTDQRNHPITASAIDTSPTCCNIHSLILTPPTPPQPFLLNFSNLHQYFPKNWPTSYLPSDPLTLQLTSFRILHLHSPRYIF